MREKLQRIIFLWLDITVAIMVESALFRKEQLAAMTEKEQMNPVLEVTQRERRKKYNNKKPFTVLICFP